MTAIRDYAIIGNCETAALIGPHGDIDWLCLPAFDSGSVFASLLDRENGGRFTLCPIEPFRVERRYQPDSAILETRFITDQGIVKLTDFFVIARSRKARFYDFTSLHPTRKMVRLVEASPGASVAMRLNVSSRPSYARQRVRWQRRSDGGFDSEQASIFANFPIELQGDDLLADIAVSHQKPLHVVLDYGDAPAAPDLPAIREWLRVTIAYWREWNLFNYYRGPHQAMVRRSAVTLKLLTYAATGGFVAAPTTSLPEKEGGELNWDYRYTWLRDTALFIQTLFGLGYSGEARAFLDFVVKKWMEKNEGNKARNDLSSIDVLYPIDGQPVSEESTLPHLSGYAHSRPVRIGNAAQDQFQLDNYGHILQSFFFLRHTGGKISATERRMLQQLTEEVVRFWKRADNGIWEVRQTSQFTYGKIMCWLALERARVLLGDEDGQLEKLAEAIRAYILEHGLTSDRNILSSELGKSALDASILLAFTTGFLERTMATTTREALEESLARGPLMYRGEDKPEQEGAFLICSFWRVNHLIREGHLKRAEELLEELISLASPLGLYAEEVDAETGASLGNFPQAFSHLGLIQSLLNLQASKKKPGFYKLADHEKFERSVGATVGWKGVIAGFFRAPRTGILFFSRASKWRSKP